MSDGQTIRLYDEKARDYQQLNPSEGPSETLRAFMARLPVGARVLDLGCGPGTSAAHMVAGGLAVDAIDASEAMVALAQKIPGVTAWQATFDDLVAVSVYDGIWANFSLLHAPRAALPEHLSATRRALVPGGIFHIALKAGTGEGRDSLGRFYTYYQQDELAGLLHTAGLEPGAFVRGESRGLDGAVAPWISVTANG